MTTEEFLAERRLRAAELALESARRRVAEADEEIAALRRQVAELEEKALAAAQRAGAEPARLQAQLEAERRLRELADRAVWAERERARELEGELRGRVERATSPVAERQLAEAERRTRQLRAELELVRHRAAEFEQQVRLAVDAAWRWLGETGERLSAGLLELEDLRTTQLRATLPVDTGVLPQAATGEAGAQAPELTPASPAPETADEAISGRFDEALSRLRSQIQPDPDTQT